MSWFDGKIISHILGICDESEWKTFQCYEHWCQTSNSKYFLEKYSELFKVILRMLFIKVIEIVNDLYGLLIQALLRYL